MAKTEDKSAQPAVRHIALTPLKHNGKFYAVGDELIDVLPTELTALVKGNLVQAEIVATTETESGSSEE